MAQTMEAGILMARQNGRAMARQMLGRVAYTPAQLEDLIGSARLGVRRATTRHERAEAQALLAELERAR